MIFVIQHLKIELDSRDLRNLTNGFSLKQVFNIRESNNECKIPFDIRISTLKTYFELSLLFEIGFNIRDSTNLNVGLNLIKAICHSKFERWNEFDIKDSKIKC